MGSGSPKVYAVLADFFCVGLSRDRERKTQSSTDRHDGTRWARQQKNVIYLFSNRDAVCGRSSELRLCDDLFIASLVSTGVRTTFNAVLKRDSHNRLWVIEGYFLESYTILPWL